jgi:putative glutamine amidotransferase
MIPTHRSRPIIGITAAVLVASYGPWKERAALVPVEYMQAIADAGGVPVILSPLPGIAEALAELIDGLVLTGGVDVDASLFGAERHPLAQRPNPIRDEFEISLLEAAVARELPVLGVCRGIHVLNVERGGTLHQHLPDVVGADTHAPTPGIFSPHRVRIDPTSQVGAIVGKAEAIVPTHHHQAVDRVGDGLVASAWADDGTVEALEDPAHPFLIGVQWHPEMGDDSSLFDHLIAATNRTSLAAEA